MHCTVSTVSFFCGASTSQSYLIELIEFVLYSCQLKQPASRGATVASGQFTSVKSELTRELFTFCIALLFSCTGYPKFEWMHEWQGWICLDEFLIDWFVVTILYDLVFHVRKAHVAGLF